MSDEVRIDPQAVTADATQLASLAETAGTALSSNIEALRMPLPPFFAETHLHYKKLLTQWSEDDKSLASALDEVHSGLQDAVRGYQSQDEATGDGLSSQGSQLEPPR